jgi:TPR repeat protein
MELIKNYKIALKYYRKSSNLNNCHALNNIAYIYKYGLKINIFKALKYYAINIKINNNSDAINNLNNLILFYKKDIYNEKLKILMGKIKDKFNELKEEEIYYLAMQDFNLFNKK